MGAARTRQGRGGWAVGLAIALVATAVAGVAPTSAGAQAPTVPTATLHSAPGFAGNSVTLTGSDPNLVTDVPDVKSIEVTGGISVALYGMLGHESLEGCLTVTGDLAAIPPGVFDGPVESVRFNWSCQASPPGPQFGGGPVAPPPGTAHVTLESASGSRVHVTDDQLLIDEGFSNVARTIRIHGDMEVALHDRRQAGGICEDLPASTEPYDLRYLGLDGRIERVDLDASCDVDRIPGVVLYRDVDFAGPRTYLAADTGDTGHLRGFQSAFDDAASSIELVGGLESAAVYRSTGVGVDTCETIVSSDARLGDNTIGNDTISTVRPGWTCQGPGPGVPLDGDGDPVFGGLVVDHPARPVVDALDLVYSGSGPVACPAGYDRREPDLNWTVGGAWIYLCVSYGWEAPATPLPVTFRGFRAHVRGLLAADLPCADRGVTESWSPLRSTTEYGGERIGDLNRGSNETWLAEDIHFCTIARSSGQPSPPSGAGRSDISATPLVDVRFVSQPVQGNDSMSDSALAAACRLAFPRDPETVEDTNLNAGLDPDFANTNRAIHTCLRWQTAPGGGGQQSAARFAQATAAPGGDVGTEGGDEPFDSFGVTVTTPTGGEVTIEEFSVEPRPSGGSTVLGHTAVVTAPPATPGDPLVLTFRFHLDSLPGGDQQARREAFDAIEVRRDGVAVAPCATDDGTAAPDPCHLPPALDLDGNGVVRVLTSQASTWSFLTPTPATPTAPVPPSPPGPGDPTDPDEAPADVAVSRIPARDAIDAAVRISGQRFDAAAGDGVAGAGAVAAHVVLARDDAFADALAGAPLTADGPLLLTPSDVLDAATAAEVRRVLAPGGTVYLLGGPDALGPAVVTALDDLGMATRRLSGPTRVETAVAIAGELRRLIGDVGTVLLARAHGTAEDPSAAWADSVTGGAWAADRGAAVLVTPGEALHPAVAGALADLAPDRTIALGGTVALADAVVEAAGADRVAGADRAGTAAAIAEQLWDGDGGRVLVVPGYRPDGWAFGLAAAGLGADRDAPLLYGDAAGLPAPTVAAVTAACGPLDLTLVGDGGVLGTQGVPRTRPAAC